MPSVMAIGLQSDWGAVTQDLLDQAGTRKQVDAKGKVRSQRWPSSWP